MTEVRIRLITPDDDFDAQADLGQRAFGRYSPGQWASWTQLAALRAGQGMFLGAFAGGAPAGAAMLHDMRQYWLGAAVGCAGVASVKVAPEHRGKGIGRRLMTELLALIAERGYPLAALFPATMPIYRSLGWELAGGAYQAAIPARSLRALPAPDAAAAGAAGAAAAAAAAGAAPEVRRAAPADAAAVIGVIGRAHRAARDAGPLTWDEGPVRQWLGDPEGYAYLAGEEGFAAYRWAGGSEELFVERLHAVTPGALRALWSVIASHSSVAATVRVLTGPSDPFWWLTRERDATLTRRSMWMLRVVDAPAAIAARGFPPAVSATVPLAISDRARPGNTGRWLLTVAAGRGALVRDETAAAAASPALALGARGLAALYAGTPVGALLLAGLAVGGTPESAAALDAVFAATPYMADEFLPEPAARGSGPPRLPGGTPSAITAAEPAAPQSRRAPWRAAKGDTPGGRRALALAAR